MGKRDFFISYTRADTIWAVWIAKVLQSGGYSVYAQILDIGPGDNFLEKMNEFLENSRNFIAVWSRSYSESWYGMREMEAAYKACSEGRMGSLLLVRVDGYPVKPLYSALVHVDLRDMGEVSALQLRLAVQYASARPLSNAQPLGGLEEVFYRGMAYLLSGDFVTGGAYLAQAAAQNYAPALFVLGVLYEYGINVQQDYQKAARYYLQSANLGYPEAIQKIASYLQN